MLLVQENDKTKINFRTAIPRKRTLKDLWVIELRNENKLLQDSKRQEREGQQDRVKQSSAPGDPQPPSDWLTKAPQQNFRMSNGRSDGVPTKEKLLSLVDDIELISKVRT